MRDTHDGPESPPPRSLHLGHTVFAGVLILRLIALLRLGASSLALPTTGDMAFYHQWAIRILHGQLTDHRAFYGLPGYAYFLAGIYRLAGSGSFVPALLQIIADSGTATLIYLISCRIFRGEPTRTSGLSRAQWIGLLAAVGWAFFVPAQAYSIVLMPTAFAVFVFWLVVWKVTDRNGPITPPQALAYGSALGLVATAVASALFAAPLLFAACWIRPRAVRAGWVASLSLAFGLAIGTAPCWLHNRLVAHDPLFLSAHSGINFWIGNNPDAIGYPRFPGMHAGQAAVLQDSIDVAEAAAGHELPRSQVSAYWSNKARTYIIQHPYGWLRLLGRKLANLWNTFEYDDLSIISELRTAGIIFPGLHFGLIASLALPGAYLLCRSSISGRWLVAAVFLQTFAILPVFVTERYRLALVPGLSLLAAFSLVTFYESVLRLKFFSLAVQGVALFLTALAVSASPRDSTLWALDSYNSGCRALDSKDLVLARRKLMQAYAYAPESAENTFALGNLALAEGDNPRAEAFYRHAAELDPRHTGAWNNLGVIALDAGNWEKAISCFGRALQTAPRNAKAHYLLARALLGHGDLSSARNEIAVALSLSPAQVEFQTLQNDLNGRTPP